MSAFQQLGIEAQLLQAITDLEYTTPTEIQEKAIPVLLDQEHDLIALAQTGTGKTAAFGLPILQNINLDKPYTQA
ncbi:MAG: DEAD/DEAH box helicase, partial [Saprospiraceae bacterium]